MNWGNLLRDIVFTPPTMVVVFASKLGLLRDLEDDWYEPIRPADALLILPLFTVWWSYQMVHAVMTVVGYENPLKYAASLVLSFICLSLLLRWSLDYAAHYAWQKIKEEQDAKDHPGD